MQAKDSAVVWKQDCLIVATMLIAMGVRRRFGVSVNDIPEDKAAPMALLRIFATLLYMVQSMPIYTTENCLLDDLISELKGVVKRDPLPGEIRIHQVVKILHKDAPVISLRALADKRFP